MIERGFAALFLSLLPMLLTHLRLSGVGVWAISSGALALYLLTALIRTSSFRRQIPAEAEAQLPGMGWSSVLAVCAVIVIAIQVLNAVGAVLEQGIGWYLLGATFVLGLAAIIFGTIVRTFASSSENAA
jgi:hypothetical protein